MKSGAILEVEEKYWLRSSTDLAAALNALGFDRHSTTRQIDTYFSDLDGKFVEANVCLRLREIGRGSITLDFKGPSVDVAATTISKIERNLELSLGDKKTCIEILNALGYTEHVVVNKTRTPFTKQMDGVSVTVAIDELSETGAFVELEVTTDQLSNEQRAREILENLRNQLMPYLGASVSCPYRDIVAEAKFRRIAGPQISVIAFDLDGTIIPQTTKIFFNAWNEVSVERDGAPISQADYEELEVHGSEGLYDLMNRRHSLSMTRDEYFLPIYARYSDHLQRWWAEHDLAQYFRPLRRLREQYKLALVTHSRREYVDEVLQQAAASDLFDTVIAREDMTALKPAPDGYLKVSELFGESPDAVLVVEDSQKGLESARKAGMEKVEVAPDGQRNSSITVPTIRSCAELVFLWLSSRK